MQNFIPFLISVSMHIQAHTADEITINEHWETCAAEIFQSVPWNVKYFSLVVHMKFLV